MANEERYPWLHYALIAAAALLAVTIFLIFSKRGIPMADSYIHFSYARNLALHRELSYNLGEIDGIGSTSLLWVLVLAGWQVIGIPPEISAIGLGIVLLASSGILVYEISRQVLIMISPERGYLFAILAALLTVVPGSMTWLALSGMEAILFLFLSLLSLRFFDLKKWLWLGLALGLLALTRTEGLILAGSIGLVEVVRQRKIPRELILTALIVVAMVAPWILYLQAREGILATASYQGRVVMVAESNARISTQPVLEWLISFNPVVYVVSWAAFLFLYASGAAGMPGPVWGLQGYLLGTKLSFPYLGWVVVFLFSIPLVVLGTGYLWRQRHRLRLDQPGQRVIFAAVLWMGLHNLAYAIFISQIGAAGRYAPMNHIFFWALLLLGGYSFKNRKIRIVSLFLVGTLLLLSSFYWQRVYAANIEYNQQVKIAAAKYIADQLPEEAAVGATDLGPIRYYAPQPVVDLIGHVNKEIGPFWEAGGSHGDYLEYREICYLMLYDTSGEAGIDFAKELGFRSDGRFGLVSEARFEIDTALWQLGSEPLRNYMPVVEVYRVDWYSSDICSSQMEKDQTDE
jgi:hypothetical protein